MALSLKCDDCGAQLRSVAEAQEHGEVTGHSNFSESTEAVLNLTCTECGKPCRSQTDCDLHTKRTGHTNFVDKTSEAAAMDTEQEMKLARDAEMADANADGGSKEVEMVPAEVNQNLLKQLTEEMGFPANRATRALHATGTENIEQAISWIVEHEGDADIDEPLMIPKGSNKVKLTPEEAKAKADEMLRAAREKRQKEEKESDVLREKQRIEMGKQMAAARKAEQEQELKRNIMYRDAEKKEAEAAMAKIKAQLEEDRKERRRKLGLPEELTEEEKAAEAKRLAEKAKSMGTKMGVAVKPVSAIEKLRGILVDMKKTDGEERSKVAWQTLLKYLGNIAKNPDEEKFRSIRLANEAFQKRVGSTHGGVEFLKGCGFEADAANEVIHMPREKVDLVLINSAGGELNSALQNPFFGVL